MGFVMIRWIWWNQLNSFRKFVLLIMLFKETNNLEKLVKNIMSNNYFAAETWTW